MSTAESNLIYIVDDEQVIAKTLAMILTQKGYAAKAFFDPTEVLRACADVVPVLLISDVVMPQMTGVDLAIRQQEMYLACRLLLFSGQSATSMYLDDASRRGYRFEVLAKPIHPVELLQRVEGIVRKASILFD